MNNFKFRKRVAVVLGSTLFFINACSTYPFETQNAQNAFYSGDYDKAAQLLEKNAKEDSKDQLLYLYDRGMALHLAGKYRESEKMLLAADKMGEIKDYTSISAEIASVLINENIKQYKGEDFEKVITNAFLAIDYVLDGQFEDALVECRRVNEKLYKYKFEAKRNYEQNPFARYLAALIWEASGNLTDAYIDYKKAEELTPDFAYLKSDLIRLAKRLDRPEDLKKWKKQFGEEVAVPTPKEEAKTGEIILIYQQGRSAVKKPHPENHRFPKFYARSSLTQTARIEVGDEKKSEDSQKIYSVSDVAIKTLDDAYAVLVAKAAANVASRMIISDQVRQKNELLGLATWIGLAATDQADVRHWSTLPETLQFARVRVAPGVHDVKIVGLTSAGQTSGEEKSFQINVAAGKKVFLNWRSLQ